MMIEACDRCGEQVKIQGPRDWFDMVIHSRTNTAVQISPGKWADTGDRYALCKNCYSYILDALKPPPKVAKS
jgi:hypothetical protein